MSKLLFAQWKRRLSQRSALSAATCCLDLPIRTLERSLPPLSTSPTRWIHLAQNVTLRRTQGDLQVSFCFILSSLHRRKRLHFAAVTATSDTQLVPFRNRRLVFLQVLVSLLTNVHTVHSPPVLNRIAKVLLSTLSVLLPTQSDLRGGPVLTTSNKGRKGKKRAYDYEADEIFKITTNVICPTLVHNAMILTTLDGKSSASLPTANTL